MNRMKTRIMRIFCITLSFLLLAGLSGCQSKSPSWVKATKSGDTTAESTIASASPSAETSGNNETTEPGGSMDTSTPEASGGQAEGKWPTKSWTASTPDKQGMDPAVLTKADERITLNYPNIYSLLVVRHGYLVYEKYYQGMGRDNANQIYSVTKSVMSALTGIAIREKAIDNLDQKISDILPDYFTKIDNADKTKITIHDILTMKAGLLSIDLNYSGYLSATDWIDYTLKKRLMHDPGTSFTYNTGLVDILSGIITKLSKMNTPDFADKYLFSRIGITPGKWKHDTKGNYEGGAGLELTPADMAKFGYLYLKNGLWDGEQIVPKDWVADSIKKQVTVNNKEKYGYYGDYGYLFWVSDMVEEVHGKTYATYHADGMGGQKIVVIPDLDMVVVITANQKSASKDNSDTLGLVPDYVLPSVIK
jgi:CubicO group peptidase (beta-lactamase class C family)